MNRGLKYLLRLNKNKNRQFIFDLDKTLWDYTVECAPHINGKDVLNYVHKSRRTILNAIQQDGHTLNIASRSKDPDKCKIDVSADNTKSRFFMIAPVFKKS